MVVDRALYEQEIIPVINPSFSLYIYILLVFYKVVSFILSYNHRFLNLVQNDTDHVNFKLHLQSFKV